MIMVMKEIDMLEQMLSSVARLLVQKEEALLERVAALEKKVEELERRLEEAMDTVSPGSAAPDKVAAVVAVDEVADEIQQVETADSEFEEDEPEMDAQVEDGADMGTLAEEVAEEESPTEPEMEIELEFFDDEEEADVEDIEVQEIEVEDAAEEDVDDRDGFEAAAEDEEAGGYDDVECEEPDDAEEETVLVMDKARPDWYDWEVDIPGPYIEDIWDGIGLNDRLLFLKELFGGDEIDFSDTLDALNEMTQLVEATEYIRGRYPHWDEESDEVYRFYMTVRRRFNKQRQ